MNNSVTTGDHSEVLAFGLTNIRVCSTLSEELALEWVRGANPAGTEENWQVYDYECNPEMAPVVCKHVKGRTHYMFEC